jgi:TonB family protein
MKHNILYYSFIISIFLHIIFFTFGNIFLGKFKSENKFQRLTFVSIAQNLEQKDEPKNKVEKEKIEEVKDTQKPKIEEKEIVKKEQIIQKYFSPYEVEKPQEKAAGGGAEILTSIKEDASLSNSQGGSFVIQSVPKGEGEGIGLGGDGSGAGVGGNENKVKMSSPSYFPPKLETETEVDKEKVLKEYIAKIVEKIKKNKKYPDSARSENIEGKIKLKIFISKSGELEEIKILSSSGYKILDNAAIDTVKRASPFNSIPDEIGRGSLTLKLDIVFKLEENL